MRKFRVKCIQISGVGRLLFNYGDEPTEQQIDNIDALLVDGAIEEIIEKKPEAKKSAAKADAKKADEEL